MFVTISIYQARDGEEDAIIGLHEDWQRTLQSQARGYLSGELLRNIKNSGEFLSIMRFETQQAAHILANNAGSILAYDFQNAKSGRSRPLLGLVWIDHNGQAARIQALESCNQ